MFSFIFFSEPATLKSVQTSFTPEGLQISWEPLEGFAEEVRLELDKLNHDTEVSDANNCCCCILLFIHLSPNNVRH